MRIQNIKNYPILKKKKLCKVKKEKETEKKGKKLKDERKDETRTETVSWSIFPEGS